MTERDTHTFLEIKIPDKLLAEVEERAENEGTDVQTLIPILCAIYVKS